MGKKEFDAIVVGAGPNGLSAAITLQQAGLSVLLLEGKNETGGGCRSSALTLPGFMHDVCSAIHPLAAYSPIFKTFPLADHGLSFVNPPISAAHPFDNGTAAILSTSVEETAASLEDDEQAYLDMIKPVLAYWPEISTQLLGPLHFMKNPLAMAKFGLKGLPSVLHLAKRFTSEKAKALLAGMAAHSLQPLSNLTTAAVALVLLTTGHINGWVISRGGSKSISEALSTYFISIGGKIETNKLVSSLKELPSSNVVLFDVTPKQLLKIAGESFSSLYRWQMKRYRYGMGVFKIDWALNGPIPFTAPECRRAGTIHIGGSMAEITRSEKLVSEGKHAESPFVLLAQQSLFDPSRSPEGKHTGWAYCHAPNGSQKDMTEAIEKQVERFAPGFRDLILHRHVMNTADMEAYNPNYIGGDINGGILDLAQLFARPVLRFSPYRSSAKEIYICSSSTPPGGGVHGMCGYHAARTALKDIFHIKLEEI